jgi:hypothetical protein
MVGKTEKALIHSEKTVGTTRIIFGWLPAALRGSTVSDARPAVAAWPKNAQRPAAELCADGTGGQQIDYQKYGI